MRRQRGVALLTALVLLALATVLAATIGFDAAMAARRSTATLGMEQSVSLVQGTEALAAYALYRDMPRGTRDPRVDATGTWATPLPPTEIIPGVGIEAQMEDEQGKFNLNTLVGPDGKRDEDSVKVFERLLELLDLEPRWAAYVVDWIDADNTVEMEGGEDSLYTSQMPPGLAANLTITSISELEQIPGFGRERYLRIAPYVTALPPAANRVNTCTAPGPVIDAMRALGEHNATAEEFSLVGAEELQKQRAQGCYPTAEVVAAGEDKVRARISETSSYFRLRSWINIGSARFALYSLMYRDENGTARPIARTFGTE